MLLGWIMHPATPEGLDLSPLVAYFNPPWLNVQKAQPPQGALLDA